MAFQNIAALLESTPMDWSALAAMVAILIGLSAAVAALINGMLISPMINKSEQRIFEKIEDSIALVVSKEVFDLYAETDQREHDAMKTQLSAIANRNTHR